MIKAKYFRTSSFLDRCLLAYASPEAVPWGERQLLNLELPLVSFSCAGTTYLVEKGRKVFVCFGVMRLDYESFFKRVLKAKMYHLIAIIALLYHGNMTSHIKYSQACSQAIVSPSFLWKAFSVPWSCSCSFNVEWFSTRSNSYFPFHWVTWSVQILKDANWLATSHL